MSRYIINLLPRPQNGDHKRYIIINYDISRNASQAFIEKLKGFNVFFYADEITAIILLNSVD